MSGQMRTTSFPTPGPWVVSEETEGHNPDIYIEAPSGTIASIMGGALADRRANGRPRRRGQGRVRLTPPARTPPAPTRPGGAARGPALARRIQGPGY